MSRNSQLPTMFITIMSLIYGQCSGDDDLKPPFVADVIADRERSSIWRDD